MPDKDDLDYQKQLQNWSDSKWPEKDDCYEYKLVGVNVHSGTANAGHYWSYINTNRGGDEQEDKVDSWMEFNDSRVTDWKFSAEL